MEALPHVTALNKAKIALMSRPDSAFFTTLAFSLRHIWDDRIPTACTNGKEIRYNPTFFMELSPEERVFLIIHETMHCAYLHMARLQDRAPMRFNIAADYVINLQLSERGFSVPSIALLDTQYAGMTTEQVYDLLPNDPPSDFHMDIEEAEGDPGKLASDIQDILVRAQIQSKMSGDKPGTIPGDIEIYLDKLLNPKLPWNRILQKYLQSFVKNDYTFVKPNRRFFPKHHLPSLYSQGLIDLAVAVDTSASVTDMEFNQFISELCLILRMMKPNKMTLVQFDTVIKSVHELEDVKDLMNVSFTGRGGTQIGPVMDWANISKPQLLLVFTDGGFYFRNATTKHPVIWLIHNSPNFTSEFGKVIHYTV